MKHFDILLESTLGSAPLCLAYHWEPLRYPQFIYQKDVVLFLSRTRTDLHFDMTLSLYFSLVSRCQQSSSTSCQDKASIQPYKKRRKEFAFLQLLSPFIIKQKIKTSDQIHFVPCFTYSKSKIQHTLHVTRIDVHRMDEGLRYLLFFLSLENQASSHMGVDSLTGISVTSRAANGKGPPSCKELMSICKLLTYTFYCNCSILSYLYNMNLTPTFYTQFP